MYVTLFVGLILFFYYVLYLKKAEGGEDESAIMLPIARFLCFSGSVAFFAWMLFDLDPLYWLAVYSVICLAFCFQAKRKKAILLCMFLFLYIARIPMTEASILAHMNEQERYACVHDLECVEVTSSVGPDGAYRTKVERYDVDTSVAWYGLFSIGLMDMIGDDGTKKTITSVNIGGYWIDL